MKKPILTLILTLIWQLTFAFFPTVRNYSKDSHGGGTQTWDITQSGSGVMYFANNDGVLEFDGVEWNLYRLPNFSIVRSLYFDASEHRLYAGGTNEFGYFEVGDGSMRYTPLLDSLGLSTTEIWRIGRTSSEDLFIEEKDKVHVIGKDGIKTAPNSNFDEDNITCTAENEYYRAEGTSSSGIYIIRKSDGNRFNLTTASGLQSNTVLSAFFDAGGNLWLGLNKGIDHINLESPMFRLFGNPDNFGAGYAFASLGEMAYIGTNIGIFCIPVSKMMGSYSDSDFTRIQGIDGQVWSLYSQDGLIFCCHDKGIFIIKDTKVQKHIPLNGVWKLMPLDGKDGVLFGCTYEEPFILKKRANSWEFSNYIEGIDMSSKAFEQDYNGTIWFSHHVKGLYAFSLDDDLTHAINLTHFGKKQGFPTDRGNFPQKYRSELIFASEGGFWAYNYSKDTVLAINALNRLFSGTANSMGIFETSDRSIRYFWNGGLQAIEYTSQDGKRIMDSLSLKSLIGKRPLGFESNSSLGGGRLMLNTENGFTIVDSHNLGQENQSGRFPPFVKSIRLKNNGNTVYIGREQTDSIVRLKYNENSIELEFVEPDYNGDKQIEYSCKLEGYNNDFSAYGTSNTKEYTKLPSGRYTFVVRSKNPLWGGLEQQTRLNISIARPWYSSTAAKILYILAILGLSAGAFKLAKRSYLRKANELARKKSEQMQKEQMKLDVESKAEDLAASTMDLMRKNELLQNISGQIDKAIEGVKGGDDSSTQLRRLRQISALIDENIEHDAGWKKFESNFDVVYSDFLKRLGEQYPNLSMSDKKLCAYLKMDLSSKEIAPLLNMTVRSVEMTRYRLRKKLGLEQGENLSEFLQRF